MTYSHRFYYLLIAFFLVLNAGVSANALELNDTYFLTVKSVPDRASIKLSECTTFQSVFPNYSSINEFVSVHKCVVTEEGKYNSSVVVDCPGSDPIPDTYYFAPKDVCELQFLNLSQFNTPEKAQLLKESLNEPWFMIQLTGDADKNFTVSECQTSPYKDPDEVTAGGRCHVVNANEVSKLYDCDSSEGHFLTYGFIRSKKMCETMHPTLIYGLKQNGGKQKSR